MIADGEVLDTEAPTRAGGGGRAAGLALAAIPCLWGLAYLFPPLNHDAAAILSYAQRIIEGGRLYVDFTDVNPPLIYWMSCVPALIAKALQGPPTTIYSATALLLIAASVALARPIFNRLAGDAPGLTRALAAPTTLFVLIVLPADGFAQREHLMAVLALPYLALSACRADRRPVTRRLALAATVMAALGFAIKPHFLAIPVLVEILVLAAGGIGRGLRDPVPWVLFALFAAYLATAAIVTPEYFSFIVPLATTYYEGGGREAWGVALASPAGLSIVGALIGLVALRGRIGWGRAIDVLICFVTGAAMAAIAQGKGWDYHFLGAKIGLILALVGAPAAALDRRIGGTVPRGAPAAILLALFFLTGALSPPWKAQRAFEGSPAGRMYRLIEARAHGRPVMWLTTSIYPQFPVLPMTRSPLALHFLSLWLLPPLYADAPTLGDQIVYHAPDAMPLAEAYLFRSVGADLAAAQPALLIVTRSADEGGFAGKRFDYLDYFGREPTFAHAFQNYRYLTQVDGWVIYERKG